MTKLPASKLLLHERTLANGALERTWLEAEGGVLYLHIEGQARAVVPIGVLEAVMRRYGKPLADDVEMQGPRVDVGGCELSVLRYRPRYDVIAKDYFVYAPAGGEALAELATAVTGALEYLLQRAGC
jgi:hypothetical protein